MEKSKLGISVRLLGTLLFFIGATNNLLIVALAVGYVLFFESDEWLKKTALKAFIFTVLFSIILFLVNHLVFGISYLFNFLHYVNIYVIEKNGMPYSMLQSLISVIQPAILIFQAIIFVILGFKTNVNNLFFV